MTTQTVPEAPESIILVFHPANAPSIFSTDGVVEFEEDAGISLPTQKAFKDAVVKVLMEFAEHRSSGGLEISARLRVDTGSQSGYPAAHVVRVAGHGVTAQETRVFRAAAQYVVGEFVAQMSLGERGEQRLLSAEDQAFLSDRSREIGRKFANKSITQGFVVRFGASDEHGTVIQGQMPPMPVVEKSNGTVTGFAYPVGFDARSHTVVLKTEAANDDGKPLRKTQDVVFKCLDAQMLKTVAQAYINASRLSFKALLQRDSPNRKGDLTLTALSEVAANDDQSFELEPD